MSRTLLILLAFLITGCINNRNTNHCFYYWKSDLNIASSDSVLLNELDVHTLYVRYFDVRWIENQQSAFPVAKLSATTKLASNIEVIPVVYIENKVIKNLDSNGIDSLSAKMSTLLHSINTALSKKPKQVQIDCDWTESTRTKYFELLTHLKSDYKDNIVWSATIRLHQVKYKRTTGVPPVDRGMLMFYNMGVLSPQSTSNSIYDYQNAANYIEYAKGYPLPFDVALPVFSWSILSRNGKGMTLLNEITAKNFKGNSSFVEKSEDRFICRKEYLLHGTFILPGDEIKVEEITPELSLKAAKQVADKLNSDTFNIVLYHLDHSITQRYEKADFQNIFSCFK
ncbi:MAG TPA: hypothetical protein PLD36_05215 [Bacteroidia bacterium]|jgi:hypothetical protein|nr:hypothetical protein [Bacteroidia bacterium]